jgi:hypothetical protein
LGGDTKLIDRRVFEILGRVTLAINFGSHRQFSLAKPAASAFPLRENYTATSENQVFVSGKALAAGSIRPLPADYPLKTD